MLCAALHWELNRANKMVSQIDGVNDTYVSVHGLSYLSSIAVV